MFERRITFLLLRKVKKETIENNVRSVVNQVILNIYRIIIHCITIVRLIKMTSNKEKSTVIDSNRQPASSVCVCVLYLIDLFQLQLHADRMRHSDYPNGSDGESINF